MPPPALARGVWAYALCDYLDQLPADFDAFMWAADSPFRKVGWIDGYRQEGREIVLGTVCRYPVEVGRLVVRNTLRQLFMFNNWYGIAPSRNFPYPTNDIKAHFPAAEFQAYAGCRQNENTLGLKRFNLLHVAVVAFCVPLAGALWLLFLKRRQFLPALFLGALAIAYGLSAFVTAAPRLSEAGTRAAARAGQSTAGREKLWPRHCSRLGVGGRAWATVASRVYPPPWLLDRAPLHWAGGGIFGGGLFFGLHNGHRVNENKRRHHLGINLPSMNLPACFVPSGKVNFPWPLNNPFSNSPT